MACDAMDIPNLKFPRNEIIEVKKTHSYPFYETSINHLQIIPASYQNEAKRIPIPGLAEEIIPGSPEDIRIPVPPSGIASPIDGLGTPAEPADGPFPNVGGTVSTDDD
jgi:6-phosphofructo-2-kinase/fructose-2,6-biphosphatase 4